MNYDYKCEQCSSQYTIEQSIYADVIAPVCATCNTVMNRLWGVGGIQFKGDGFYVNGG